MNSSLLGQSLYLQTSITVVVREGEWRTYLACLPGGETVDVKANDDLNPKMLVADWHGRELLVFERDLLEARTVLPPLASAAAAW